LDFGYSNFLTVWAVKRPILHYHAKFCEDLTIRCCDIAIFVVFQDGGRRHLFFENFEILTIFPIFAICVTVPNFIKIDQTVAEI